MTSRSAASPPRVAGLWTACALSALVATPALADTKPIVPQGTILTAGNGFLQVHIESTPGDGIGLFTVTTEAGKNVLYGNGKPGTSYTTIHSYTTGTDYVQGDGKPGIDIDPYGSVTPLGDTGFRVAYRLPGGSATPDGLTIVQDIVVTGDTAADSRVDVNTFVTDTGETPEQIGVRYLWDYDIDGDDGPVLAISPSADVSTETILATAGATLAAVNGSTASAASDSVVDGAPVIPPDSVRYVSWAGAFHSSFDYAVDPSVVAGGSDSAVLTYFGSLPSTALSIPAGQSATVTASISANVITPDAISVTVDPKVVLVGQNVTAICRDNPGGDDKVKWNAPGGTPATGTGKTFTTSYKTVGQKTITASNLAGGATMDVIVSVIKVNFDVDGETAANKSLVFVRNTVGVIEGGNPVTPLRLKTPCHIWVEGNPADDVKVVLLNPDSRLLFTTMLTATTKLTLPADGTKVTFLLYGQTQSAAVGDAVVQCQLDDATKAVLATQPTTVFFFDPTLTLAPDGRYVVVGGLYMPAAGKVGINMGASARARPATTDVDAGVLAGINIGVAQNALSLSRTALENNPLVRWNADIMAGTQANVPSTLTRTAAVATTVEDTLGAAADPLYTATTARPNAAAMATSDSPQTFAGRLDIPVKDANTNEPVGTAVYTVNQVTFNDHFRTWCVAFQNATRVEFPQMEGTWDLTFNTGSPAANQIATTGGAPVAAVTPPVRGAPFANDAFKVTVANGANVVMTQPGVASVALAPAMVAGGTASKGTVTLTAPAGFGGTLVTLGTNRAAVAAPAAATVTVPAGMLTATFDINTFAVAANENVRIVASCNSSASAARLTVTK